ncbi:MAG TPA: aminopeptidase [Candidatus Dorea intestinavium]|nr:aminopeptidase [Candidatus Dorea intestinavium]
MRKERYELAINRIKAIGSGSEKALNHADFFEKTAQFLLLVDQFYSEIATKGLDHIEKARLKEMNQLLYQEILPQAYETSYANPDYAFAKAGKEYGALFTFVSAYLRKVIPYIFEQKEDYIIIFYELYLEIYTAMEQEDISAKEIQAIIYWHVSDYADVFDHDRILKQIDSSNQFYLNIIEQQENDLSYLYKYGVYIGENEEQVARYLKELPEETIEKMADNFTEGYRRGFINTGKILSIKETVGVRFRPGFERIIAKAIDNFKKLGLKATISLQYYGGGANPQYDFDHRNDLGLIFDKKLMERRLEVIRTTYEENKELAAKFAGPAVMESFGEAPFSPIKKENEITYDEEQEKLLPLYLNKQATIVNTYIKGEERSYTIVDYPIPEIGDNFKEIFAEVIKINTLDSKVYEKIQQEIIEVLDQGKTVSILGKGKNRTNLTVALQALNDPARETIFENCTADVNIPVGEVFTTPKLKGTNGLLHVTGVFLNGLFFKDLEIEVKDGMVTNYNCKNFEKEEDNKKYIFENIMFNHNSLPMGEFAIGTNTTAYAAAKKYQIEDKFPILIAEKTGPHFAFGDTCYSRSEEIKVYNPNKKEIIAKANDCKEYFNCHTDITIPYNEIAEIKVIDADKSETTIIKEGLFVLAGTKSLNDPLINIIH